MEKQIEDFYRSLRGRRVAFIGTGVTNQQCIELFARCGAQITLCDKKPDIDAFGPYAQALRKLDIRFSLGEHYLDGLAGQEMIMRTPGFEYYTPELVAAREAGAEVTRRGYPWGMVTNGMALTPERFGRLLDAGLKSVSVSLDGFEREHNYIRGNPRSYDRALEAVRMIVREPSLSYDVVTCVTGAMVPQLEAFRDMLLSEGVRHWRLFSIFPMGRAKNDPTLRMTDAQFREMLEFIRRTRQEGRIEVSYACEGFLGGYEAEVRDHFYQCAAGVSVASIRVDGAISGCTSIRANYHQGNIYRDRFWDVWQNRFEPFRDREWARRGECADCSMFRYCQGGGMHLRGDDGELLYCHYRRL